MGYAPGMRFSSEELRLLDASQEVEIETVGHDGTVHGTIIWVVVDDETVLIRSDSGPGAGWYREALANPAVAIHLDGRRLSATAVPATDPDSIERASAGYRRKYAGDPATPAMVAEDNLPTNLRLAPA